MYRNNLSEIASNSRTLILSLVLSLGVLVPLRFFEAGAELALVENELNVQAKVMEYKAVRLANANRELRRNQALASVNGQTAVLGVSTDSSSGKCLSAENAQDLINTMWESYKLAGGIPQDQVGVYTDQVEGILERVCKN